MKEKAAKAVEEAEAIRSNGRAKGERRPGATKRGGGRKKGQTTRGETTERPAKGGNRPAVKGTKRAKNAAGDDGPGGGGGRGPTEATTEATMGNAVEAARDPDGRIHPKESSSANPNSVLRPRQNRPKGETFFHHQTKSTPLSQTK